jgi:hypothetical protein
MPQKATWEKRELLLDMSTANFTRPLRTPASKGNRVGAGPIRPTQIGCNREAGVKIKNEKDFWSGVMFIGCGLFFALFALKYDFGTAQRMGPAYFPTVLGALLAILGVVIALTGLAKEEKDSKVERFNFKEVGWVVGSIVLFGILLIPAGAMVAILVLVIVSMIGSHEFHWKEVVILAIAMAIMVYLVFIWGLGVTIPVAPAFMNR